MLTTEEKGFRSSNV